MKISVLKNLNNTLPDPVKNLFAPLIRQRLIGNPIFKRQMSELKQMDRMTDLEISDLQMRKLKETLLHAYEHTRYYKDLFDAAGFDVYHFQNAEEMKVLPLLTKKMIAENYEALQADDVKDAYDGETGGSTGEPLKLLLSRESIYMEKAFIYHFWGKYGYDYRNSRIVTFRGVEFHGKFFKSNPLYNEILLNPFLLKDSNIREYIEKIEDFKADFVHGYPSAIANFCRLLNIHQLKIKRRIKAVFLVSESCSPDQKELIERTLHCEIAVFYGHTERAAFAEAHRGTLNYSFNPLYGYIETEKHPYGNILCTGFINRKFPLIRYAVDDEAIEAEHGTFEIESHRAGALLYGIDGEQFTQTAFNFHDDTFSAIAAYQLYQDQIGHAECRVQGKGELSEQELAKIRNNLIRKCGNCIQWTVIPVDHFELTARGKFKTLIQKCKKEDETIFYDTEKK